MRMMRAKDDLFERLNDDDWAKLEEAAVYSAVSGGMAAMGFYRDALRKQTDLENSKNASTMADVQATIAILRAAHGTLPMIAGTLGCALSYLAEETNDKKKRSLVSSALSDDIRNRLHEPERFFSNSGLRVILDAIDGTGNFGRGIPLFCSAVAILLDSHLRVSAIYDPIHHVVYSGMLKGPNERPEADSSAWVWHVAIGSRTPFPEITESKKRPLGKEPVAVHLSRTKKDSLVAFLRPDDPTQPGPLEDLALKSGGIYALNSGILAMAEVARGSLGGFVNVATNPWDIAAGEVLVRASGGKVTDIHGQRVSYSTTKRASVVAAKAHLHGKILKILGQKDW